MLRHLRGHLLVALVILFILVVNLRRDWRTSMMAAMPASFSYTAPSYSTAVLGATLQLLFPRQSFPTTALVVACLEGRVGVAPGQSRFRQ